MCSSCTKLDFVNLHGSVVELCVTRLGTLLHGVCMFELCLNVLKIFWLFFSHVHTKCKKVHSEHRIM